MVVVMEGGDCGLQCGGGSERVVVVWCSVQGSRGMIKEEVDDNKQ